MEIRIILGPGLQVGLGLQHNAHTYFFFLEHAGELRVQCTYILPGLCYMGCSWAQLYSELGVLTVSMY
jgi:hypothetical protein